jgi:hypothetical protein
MANQPTQTSSGAPGVEEVNSEVDRDEAEGNPTLRRVWDEPGGEAYAYRQATQGPGNRDEGHDELTALETPETTRHLSDATLTEEDIRAANEGIARATAVNGKEG